MVYLMTWRGEQAVYKIGEFSRITGITVKALRYYDQENMLKPSSRSDNGYRFYDDHDFKAAETISLLRGLHFTISEIKDVLSSMEAEEDLFYFLSEKKQQIAKNIALQQQTIQMIERQMKPRSRAAERRPYAVHIEEAPACRVAAMRFRGKYSEMDRRIPLLARAAGSAACGPFLNCYFSISYEETAEIDLCVPIQTQKTVSGRGIAVKTLPAVKAAGTMHHGKYEDLKHAYKALIDYAKDHGHTLSAPVREIYIKHPGAIFRGNPDNYETKILIPIE